ncbi:MAG: alpha-galactosidase [Chloroflexota bacterium]|nr:alpha-galactosidase [Chloroflexota bacterium]
MPKIALIGAGSATFSRRLLADFLSWPELQSAELALMDVNAERLDLIEALARRMVETKGIDALVTATTDRGAALDGADYVISTLAIGYAYEPDRPDVAIPEKYGLHQTVADTIGVGGVFRYLRTMPAMLEIGQDMLRRCPNALWLNYVNPMNMIMWTIGEALPGLRNVGLCHSVQGTAERLAGFVGTPHEELSYWVAGINHQAWFLDLRHGTYRGEDLYPRLREAMGDPEKYDKDRVRFEVMRHFGYFVTESSRHMSEYVPWFRRTAADRERYTPAPARAVTASTNGAGQLASVPTRREQVWDSIKQQIAGDAPVDLKRSREYCSYIVRAVEANVPFRFNGNVPNTGLITNLPPGCNVEVPIFVDGAGLHPSYVGDLPSQLAAINRTNVNVQELAVKGFLQRDREAIHQACAVDPLAAATTSLEDVRAMVDELFDANARWLDGWASRSPAASHV